MIDLQKIQESIAGLTQQRDELSRQLAMVEGALQFCRQLLQESTGSELPVDSEKEANVKEQPI